MNYSAHAAHYRLLTNTGDVRTETRGGRDYLVAPVVLVKEGVLNGGFLPAEEIRKSVNGWNGQPVTVGHPQANGEYVSANTPEMRDEYAIGAIYNAEYRERDRALTGEAWVDIEVATALGDAAIAVVKRLAAFAQGEASEDDLMDVSTGYFHQFNEESGTFNDERYHEEQFNLLPDHLAILPNEEGACSVADGCGTPRVHSANGEPVADAQDETRSVLELHELLHGSESGSDEPAEPGAADDVTMGKKTERLVENHGFDAENLPDEDSECFNRIFEAFVDEDDDQPTPDDEEQNDEEEEQAEPVAADGGEPLTKADLESVKEELREEMKAEQNAKQAASLIERIEANSEYSADDLDGWEPEQLEVLAEQVTKGNAAPRQPGVNYAGRGSGEPTANAGGEGEWDDYEPPMVVHAEDGDD